MTRVGLRPAVVLALLAGLVVTTRAADPPKEFKVTDDEKKLIELTNAERKKLDLPPLKGNLTLCKIARAHSENMARQGKMAHVLDGKNPSQRVRAGGYAFVEVGENLATSDGSPLEEIMQSWMASPPHKANVVKKEFREIGIGIARNEKGELYYTQVFGRR